jgi:hypothetical protein
MKIIKVLWKKKEKKNGKREKKFERVMAQPKQLERPSCVYVCVMKFDPKYHFCYILVYRG